MKQLIVPIVLIVTLMAFFVIIDRKDFYRRDTVQTVPTEQFSTKRKETIGLRSENTHATPVAVQSKEEAHSVSSQLINNEIVMGDASKVIRKADTLHVKTYPKDKPAPVAIPAVMSAEEAMLLVEKQEKEREEARKQGWCFYEERFSSMLNVSSNIQQTVNWSYVLQDTEPDTTSIAKKQDLFIVKSEKPLEYVFSEPLYEHTIYQYLLCCSVKGNGIVVLSQKNGNDSKEFQVNSLLFETLIYPLGNGDSLNTPIVPSIIFKGDLQVESVSLRQLEINNQRTVCLGSIESISNVPDIKKSNYPDCYYTARFVIKDILDGNPAPQNIQLLIPAFLDNKISPLSTVVKKGNWKVSIRPFSLATKKEQEIEQVDEIDSFLFTPYILVAACPDNNLESTVSGIPILEGESYVSPFDNPVNPPFPDIFEEDSKKEIKKELEKVSSIIEQVQDDKLININFQSAWDEKQKKYDSLSSTIIWAREENSFFALPKKWKIVSSAKITEDNVDAIVELNHLFKSNGILLIIQIIPDYRDIAALVLNPSFQKYGDQRSARVAKQLLERGVEVQYISDELVKNALKYERLFFYPNDFHPDEGTTDMMTSRMARRLELFGDVLPKDLDIKLFSRENRDTGYGNKLRWPKNVDIGKHEADSNVQVPYVLYNHKILNQNPKSKVLVFGNSFIQEPMTKNAYISYLASKIMHTCSCVGMNGISALTSLPQLFLSNPNNYFKNKIVAVLPVSITYLTDNRYVLPNVAKVDETFKNASKSKFITSLPIKQGDFPVFPSSFNFSYTHLGDYLFVRTSCVSLSASQPKMILSIPEDVNANKARISIQPLYGYGVSILFNGKTCNLPSRSNPKWEILEFELEKTDRSISIEMDIDKCSSKEAKILLGNVSLFE